MEKNLSFPLLISSMTGGDHELVRTINRNLATAAERESVAMGVGSQRVMFDHPAARDSFAIREAAPNTLLFANLGAVQLNHGFGIEECRAAVEVVDADGIYFHLNPLQEAVQPDGDTRFGGLARKIADVAAELPVPVILKEVGAGLSRTDAALFAGSAVRYLDVAGTGGLSWSRIEHHRNQDADDLGLAFQDWGIPTPVALQQLAPLRDKFTLIASGGIRSGIDMAKAMVLGASLCGMASPFLQPATDSADAVTDVIHHIRREFETAMFLLGVRTVEALEGNKNLLLHPPAE
jgi:isopentenyl-diphosphate delta-isomerase